LVVCSPGGHLNEALEFFPELNSDIYKYVLHFPPNFYDHSSVKFSNSILAPHAERDIRAVKQLFFAIYIVLKFRPRIVVSTGAMIGVIFGFAAKLIGAKFIFLESPTRVLRPSLSAKIAYYFADCLFVRNEELLKFFPNAIFLR
jgi:UDP-N-acetylglucosamine:LPS N-acetylglucosamine transferase